jgi:hypothetical protein
LSMTFPFSDGLPAPTIVAYRYATGLGKVLSNSKRLRVRFLMRSAEGILPPSAQAAT